MALIVETGFRRNLGNWPSFRKLNFGMIDPQEILVSMRGHMSSFFEQADEMESADPRYLFQFLKSDPFGVVSVQILSNKSDIPLVKSGRGGMLRIESISANDCVNQLREHGFNYQRFFCCGECFYCAGNETAALLILAALQ